MKRSAHVALGGGKQEEEEEEEEEEDRPPSKRPPRPPPSGLEMHPCKSLRELSAFLHVVLDEYVRKCLTDEQLPDYHLVCFHLDEPWSEQRVILAIQELCLRVAFLHKRLLPRGKQRDMNHSIRNAQLYDFVNLAGYADVLPPYVQKECLRNKKYVEDAESRRCTGFLDRFYQAWCYDPEWRMQQVQKAFCHPSQTTPRTTLCYDDL